MSVLSNTNSILFQVPQIISTSNKTMNPATSSFLSMQGASLEACFQLLCVIHKHSTSWLLRQLLIMSKTALPQSSLLHLTTSHSFLFKGHPILYSIFSPHTRPPSLDQSPSFSHTVLLCPLQGKLPVAYLSPGIFSEGFLPES